MPQLAAGAGGFWKNEASKRQKHPPGIAAGVEILCAFLLPFA